MDSPSGHATSGPGPPLPTARARLVVALTDALRDALLEGDSTTARQALATLSDMVRSDGAGEG